MRPFPTTGDWLRLEPFLRNVQSGWLDVGLEVTLTPGAASTLLESSKIHSGSVIVLMPLTLNAATALATTYFDLPGRESITIRHAVNGQTDRSFRCLCFG